MTVAADCESGDSLAAAFPARAFARISATDGFFTPDVAAGVAALEVGAGLGGASVFAAFGSTGFGSGFGTIFRKDGSMSYQPMLLYWSNSTRQRPFMLTVFTRPVALANRASSGARESTTT